MGSHKNYKKTKQALHLSVARKVSVQLASWAVAVSTQDEDNVKVQHASVTLKDDLNSVSFRDGLKSGTFINELKSVTFILMALAVVTLPSALLFAAAAATLEVVVAAVGTGFGLLFMASAAALPSSSSLELSDKLDIGVEV